MIRRKKRRIHIRCIICVLTLLAIIILLIICFIKLDKAVGPSAKMQAEKLSEHMAYQIITDTVSQYITENGCKYDSFSTIVYDEQGNVSSVEALSNNINRIQSELASEINENMNLSGNTQAEIPLGNISGSYLLADRGPVIKVGICPVGTAKVKLVSFFDTAGINQSVHRIYADISADMTSSFPLYSFETRAEFRYLIAETVIIGEVPDYSLRAWNGNM
ncbi:MAG: sporulation protein YunB [Ruminococcus sp.]|nr:sporulation protein YunB [Ruminococcus sp.]